ncbi:disks large-associated protein 5-like [Cataglyphis hispanica]|uniref:disks large-associated protein 5-like n=1 Tax=Cataglyphis hispanica TaxID=1086592 RepID=UPI00217FB630|nr:disks large-associated protein 5-like [Cataglyphis hispanica]
MSDLKNQYKKPPSTFGNVKKIKSDLARKQQIKSKKRRTKEFEENREKKDLSHSSTNSQKDKTKRKLEWKINQDKSSSSTNSQKNSEKDESKKKLLEWKVEREKKKKEQEKQKKPPFIVGIVRHNFYSPIAAINNSIAITKKKTNVQAQEKSKSKEDYKFNQKKITKATEKRRANREQIEKQKAAKISNAKKSLANDNCVDINKQKSFAPLNHKFNPPANICVSLFGEVCVEDNLTNENNMSAHNNSTNAIPVSSSNEFPTKDATIEKSDMPIEEKEYTVEYFKHLYYKEEDRLQKHCKYWKEIQSKNDITEDIRCHINQAIGQTTLLIDKKFKRFNRLILICEKGNTTTPMVTCTDLHGFWDVMYIDVKDCDSRFEKLKELQARNWQEEKSFYTNPATKEINVKKQNVSRSSLQASISSDKTRKMIKMQDNEKDPQQILLQPISTRINNEFFTPINDKGTVEIIDNSCNVTRRKCCKDLLKIYAHPIYTSTPLNGDKSNNINASLVTMKINQLYNKFTMQTDDHTNISLEETSRKSIMEKLEKPRQGLTQKSARDASNNLTLKKQSDLEISQNSQVLLKKINNFELEKLKVPDTSERNLVERKTDNTTDSSLISSFSTLIEKTMEDKNETLKWVPCNNDLIETPVSSGIKDKRSLKERS